VKDMAIFFPCGKSFFLVLWGMDINRKTSGRGSPARVGPLLDRILSGYGLAHELNGWRIVVNWARLTGAKIASVSKAVRFRDEVLVVSVPDASWRQQLSLEVEAILRKIHSFEGGEVVKRIHFTA